MTLQEKVPLILVVDDDEMISGLFCAFLESKNFNTVTANSLRSAKEALLSDVDKKIDLIVLDYELGDGVGIDLLKGNNQVSDICKKIPIVMVSSNDEPGFLQECFSGGVNEYVIKPVNLSLLALKIEALIKSVSMQRVIEAQKNELEIFKINAEREEQIAKFTYEYLLKQYSKPQSGVEVLFKSHSAFSGDIILMKKSPGGSFNFILADATGHGLSAAITILPVATIFNSMVSKGFHIQQIVTEINHKLVTDTPEDRFVAAAVIEINPIRNEISVWNGGMPTVLWVSDGKIIHEFGSMHMALGILGENMFDANVVTYDLPDEGYIFVSSDGLIEQENYLGIPFSIGRVKKILESTPASEVVNVIANELEVHVGVDAYHDDISICTIDPKMVFDDVNYSQVRVFGETIYATHSSPFTFQIKLSGRKLANCDIPPLCNHFLQQLGFEQNLCQKIFALIAEMISNALDHGVLNLSSSIKETTDGFIHYYTERDARLKKLSRNDFVMLSMYWNTEVAPNRLLIEVEDSGPGYDMLNKKDGPSNYSGRGMTLIKSISESVEILAPGNKIRAIVK